MARVSRQDRNMPNHAGNNPGLHEYECALKSLSLDREETPMKQEYAASYKEASDHGDLYEYEDEDGGDSENEDDLEDDNAGPLRFVPKPILAGSSYLTRSLSQILDLLDSPFLDLNPEYQRDVVWADTRMSALIDSLMENYYIPPVIFNVQEVKTAEGEKRWKRTCIDGKQRLSSVRDFMKGRIPCKDIKGNKWFYCHKEDRDGNVVPSKRLLLPDNIKEEFRSKLLVCYEFDNLSTIQERDLFKRVQEGVVLKSAEKFRATTGAWQTLAKLYESDFPKVVNGKSIEFEFRSSGRILIGAKLLFAQILEVQHPSRANGHPAWKGHRAHLERFLRDEAALTDATKFHLRRVFSLFSNLVEQDPQTFRDNDNRVVRTFAPIELVCVAVLLSMHGLDRTGGMLLGDIRALRKFLRQKHDDLRMNGTIWSSAWEFIRDLEAYRGTADGSTIPKKIVPKQKGRTTRNSLASKAFEETTPAPAITHTRGLIIPVAAAAASPEINTSSTRMASSKSRSPPRILRLESSPTCRPSYFNDRNIKPPSAVAGAVNVRASDTVGSTLPSPASDKFDAGKAFFTAQQGVPVATMKRRAQLDLGSENTGARALAAKKARFSGN
ncbi:MAG: hypothetical protein M1827_001188 [Pycnora praestabilis]|nr:MAG: hypothetical protein M1827_001188 [Pycnora praestabilis]